MTSPSGSATGRLRALLSQARALARRRAFRQLVAWLLRLPKRDLVAVNEVIGLDSWRADKRDPQPKGKREIRRTPAWAKKLPIHVFVAIAWRLWRVCRDRDREHGHGCRNAGVKEAFLKALGDTGNVRAAAKTAGVHHSRVYRWRRGDAGFRTTWDQTARTDAKPSNSAEEQLPPLERRAYRDDDRRSDRQLVHDFLCEYVFGESLLPPTGKRGERRFRAGDDGKVEER